MNFKNWGMHIFVVEKVVKSKSRKANNYKTASKCERKKIYSFFNFCSCLILSLPSFCLFPPHHCLFFPTCLFFLFSNLTWFSLTICIISVLSKCWEYKEDQTKTQKVSVIVDMPSTQQRSQEADKSQNSNVRSLLAEYHVLWGKRKLREASCKRADLSWVLKDG